MNLVYDATQRDWLCVLRSGKDGELDQEIFINEDPHEWNEVHILPFYPLTLLPFYHRTLMPLFPCPLVPIYLFTL